MAYPGNLELSSQAQERVMTAFRQVVSKLQDGQREEALIGLEFVLRLDPDFRPAVNLHKQLASGAAEIDLSEIIFQLQAPTTDALNTLLVEAVEDFNQRNFVAAKTKVEQVLLELPGHQDARQLLSQVQESLKIETQVAQFLAQAREALDQGDPQEGANFVMMAQALDPHHPGIESTLQDIYAVGLPHRADAPAASDTVSFGTVSEADSGAFGVEFGAAEPPAAAAARPPARPATPTHEPPPPEVATGSLWDDGDDAGPAAPDEPDEADDFAGGVDDLFDAGGDVADLFEAEPELPPADVGDSPAAADEAAAGQLESLLEQGENAFAGDDFMGAIDIWSRVFLLDPEHRLAAERIDDARRRLDEVERRVEHVLYDVNDALVSGDVETAGRLLDEVRVIAPHHLRAEELRQRLADEPTSSARPLQAASAAPAMPDLDDDLFREETPLTVELDQAPLVPDTVPAAGAAPPPRPQVRRPRIPWRMVAAGLGGLVVILLGVWLGSWLLGGADDTPDPAALNELMERAEALYQQHKVEEAVHLLQQYQPADDLDRTRIERRLAKYQADLAPPTPTPVPATVNAASELLDSGRWYAAYAPVAAGLAKHPGDAGLLALKDRILEIEPDVAAAYSALGGDNPRMAVGLLEDLEQQHPDQPEIGADLARALFNAALAELRVYNLTGAEGMLRRLQERAPDDHEVERILEFIDEYKARPVDMRLQIFIRNLEPR